MPTHWGHSAMLVEKGSRHPLFSAVVQQQAIPHGQRAWPFQNADHIFHWPGCANSGVCHVVLCSLRLMHVAGFWDFTTLSLRKPCKTTIWEAPSFECQEGYLSAFRNYLLSETCSWCEVCIVNLVSVLCELSGERGEYELYSALSEIIASLYLGISNQIGRLDTANQCFALSPFSKSRRKQLPSYLWRWRRIFWETQKRNKTPELLPQIRLSTMSVSQLFPERLLQISLRHLPFHVLDQRATVLGREEHSELHLPREMRHVLVVL